jgi:asparagine synthase (glutamine-hydrolysing)
MLLKCFPEFYKSIPWQKTGLPISISPKIHRVYSFGRRFYRKLCAEISRVGWRLPSTYSYVNYNLLTSVEPARQFILDRLLGSNVRWQSYLPIGRTQKMVKDHFDGKRLDASGVLLLLTFEVWLEETAL